MANVSSDRPRVLVVDDSPFIRQFVVDTVRADGAFEVAAAVASGEEAIAAVAALAPDVVTLDIEMPGLGGLETLGYLMAESPRPVVVLSGHTTRAGVDLVVQALEMGAVDFVRKPSHGEGLDTETLGRRLAAALHAAVGGSVRPPRVVPPRPWRPRVARPMGDAADEAATRVVVVAASTGGPRTLAEVVAALELPAGTGMVIAQHMPAGFTASLAARLHDVCAYPVRESQPAMPVAAGTVVLAAGGRNWRLAPRDGVVQWEEDHRASAVRPSADLLLESAAAAFGSATVAVILTGMGRDGAQGARFVRSVGGRVLIQAPETTVVPGMPQAAMDAAGADLVGAPADLVMAIARGCERIPASSRRA